MCIASLFLNITFSQSSKVGNGPNSFTVLPELLYPYVGMYRGPDGNKDYYQIDSIEKRMFISGGYGGNWEIIGVDTSSGQINVERTDDSTEKVIFGNFVKRLDGKYDIERIDGTNKVLYKYDLQ